MRIVLVGGGSGGHVTPLKAITAELPKGTHTITVITNRGFVSETKQVFTNNPEVSITSIFAGKYRRYHSKSLLWHVTHAPTLFKNLRDILYIALGYVQSLYLLIKLKPDVVFCKGGFVCIPVGFAAKVLGIRLIIHDSDTRPGLTNRILSRWASQIATGMPASFYPYPVHKMLYTGMPVDVRFKPISTSQLVQYKRDQKFAKDQPVLLVTGGGNGADSLNKLVAQFAEQLLGSGWGIIHICGLGKSEPLLKVRDTLPSKMQEDWHVEEFVDMAPRMLAADVIVARTSATTLQEAANAKKVFIGVPSPHLDDQKLNAEYFAKNKAILNIDEQSVTPQEFVSVVQKHLSAGIKKGGLADTLHTKFSKPDAAKQLAQIITQP